MGQYRDLHVMDVRIGLGEGMRFQICSGYDVRLCTEDSVCSSDEL